MRYINLIALCMVLAGSNLALADYNPLLGVRFAASQGDFTNLDEKSTTGTGFVLGVLDTNQRIYADLALYSWDTVDTRTIYANYDYIFHPVSNWQLYAGVFAGLVDLQPQNNKKNYQSGPAGGVQFGLIKPLGASNFSLELGARFAFTSAEVEDEGLNKDVSIDSYQEVFIGFNFSS